MACLAKENIENHSKYIILLSQDSPTKLMQGAPCLWGKGNTCNGSNSCDTKCRLFDQHLFVLSKVVIKNPEWEN